MLFTSGQFLLFLPCILLLCFVTPSRFRWALLLTASYYFYACFSLRYVALLLAVTGTTYACALLIGRANQISDSKRKRLWKKIWLLLGLAFSLAILLFFKYFHFMLDALNALLLALRLGAIQFEFRTLLPVGISFYIFQALGYIIDVYRGTVPPERHLGKYALFVSFFPQLASGPIGRAHALLPQIHAPPPFSYVDFRNGLLLMAWGFFQKLVIADRAATMIHHIFAQHAQLGGMTLALGALLFSVQIYCDFSGYSDIAVGCAQAMGFSLIRNFRQPYFAASIADFWRRWHISLSTWFRDYLYIPLGGSRCSQFLRYRNILVTFLASGLWHGANWTFVAWGLLHGLYQIAGILLRPLRERCTALLRLDRHKKIQAFLRVACTFALTSFAWIWFRAASFTEALSYIRGLFSGWRLATLWDGTLYQLGLAPRDFWVLWASIAALWGVDWLRRGGAPLRHKITALSLPLRWGLYTALVFAILFFGLYGGDYEGNAFIYFQF